MSSDDYSSWRCCVCDQYEAPATACAILKSSPDSQLPPSLEPDGLVACEGGCLRSFHVACLAGGDRGAFVALLAATAGASSGGWCTAAPGSTEAAVVPANNDAASSGMPWICRQCAECTHACAVCDRRILPGQAPRAAPVYVPMMAWGDLSSVTDAAWLVERLPALAAAARDARRQHAAPATIRARGIDAKSVCATSNDPVAAVAAALRSASSTGTAAAANATARDTLRAAKAALQSSHYALADAFDAAVGSALIDDAVVVSSAKRSNTQRVSKRARFADKTISYGRGHLVICDITDAATSNRTGQPVLVSDDDAVRKGHTDDTGNTSLPAPSTIAAFSTESPPTQLSNEVTDDGGVLANGAFITPLTGHKAAEPRYEEAAAFVAESMINLGPAEQAVDAVSDAQLASSLAEPSSEALLLGSEGTTLESGSDRNAVDSALATGSIVRDVESCRVPTATTTGELVTEATQGAELPEEANLVTHVAVASDAADAGGSRRSARRRSAASLASVNLVGTTQRRSKTPSRSSATFSIVAAANDATYDASPGIGSRTTEQGAAATLAARPSLHTLIQVLSPPLVNGALLDGAALSASASTRKCTLRRCGRHFHGACLRALTDAAFVSLQAAAYSAAVVVARLVDGEADRVAMNTGGSLPEERLSPHLRPAPIWLRLSDVLALPEGSTALNRAVAAAPEAVIDSLLERAGVPRPPEGYSRRGATVARAAQVKPAIERPRRSSRRVAGGDATTDGTEASLAVSAVSGSEIPSVIDYMGPCPSSLLQAAELKLFPGGIVRYPSSQSALPVKGKRSRGGHQARDEKFHGRDFATATAPADMCGLQPLYLCPGVSPDFICPSHWCDACEMGHGAGAEVGGGFNAHVASSHFASFLARMDAIVSAKSASAALYAAAAPISGRIVHALAEENIDVVSTAAAHPVTGLFAVESRSGDTVDEHAARTSTDIVVRPASRKRTELIVGAVPSRTGYAMAMSGSATPPPQPSISSESLSALASPQLVLISYPAGPPGGPADVAAGAAVSARRMMKPAEQVTVTEDIAAPEAGTAQIAAESSTIGAQSKNNGEFPADPSASYSMDMSSSCAGNAISELLVDIVPTRGLLNDADESGAPSGEAVRMDVSAVAAFSVAEASERDLAVPSPAAAPLGRQKSGYPASVRGSIRGKRKRPQQRTEVGKGESLQGTASVSIGRSNDIFERAALALLEEHPCDSVRALIVESARASLVRRVISSSRRLRACEICGRSFHSGNCIAPGVTHDGFTTRCAAHAIPLDSGVTREHVGTMMPRTPIGDKMTEVKDGAVQSTSSALVKEYSHVAKTVDKSSNAAALQLVEGSTTAGVMDAGIESVSCVRDVVPASPCQATSDMTSGAEVTFAVHAVTDDTGHTWPVSPLSAALWKAPCDDLAVLGAARLGYAAVPLLLPPRIRDGGDWRHFRLPEAFLEATKAAAAAAAPLKPSYTPIHRNVYVTRVKPEWPEGDLCACALLAARAGVTPLCGESCVNRALRCECFGGGPSKRRSTKLKQPAAVPPSAGDGILPANHNDEDAPDGPLPANGENDTLAEEAEQETEAADANAGGYAHRHIPTPAEPCMDALDVAVEGASSPAQVPLDMQMKEESGLDVSTSPPPTVVAATQTDAAGQEEKSSALQRSVLASPTTTIRRRVGRETYATHTGGTTVCVGSGTLAPSGSGSAAASSSERSICSVGPGCGNRALQERHLPPLELRPVRGVFHCSTTHRLRWIIVW